MAIAFDGFPFLAGHTGRALQVDAYRDGKRRLSVMSLAGDDFTLRVEPGRVALEVDAWAPFPGVAVRGRVAVEGPPPGEGARFEGAHRWDPLVLRGEGRFDLGVIQGSGRGYADGNADDRPLHRALRSWVWARRHGPDATEVWYRIVAADGAVQSLHVRGDDVRAESFVVSGWQRPSAFGIPLPTRIGPLTVGRPVLTAPFYVRLPTAPRGLAEIGRPRAIPVAGLRHLVAMRPTGRNGEVRILHRAERLALAHRLRGTEWSPPRAERAHRPDDLAGGDG